MLVEKYQRKLARLLSRMIRDQAEVEDVVQESFIKAYRALPNFRGDSAFILGYIGLELIQPKII
jgi:RNA polymerase sigma-70 factor (ECF subfamily)